MIKIDIKIDMDKTTSEKLSLISYNCEYADKVRLPFLEMLFSQCDFLFIQEHGLCKSNLSLFHILGKDVGVHGVSAMNEAQINGVVHMVVQPSYGMGC